MEFLDEDARPRFLFQSGAAIPTESQPYQKPNKPFLFFTVTFSSILLLLSLFFFQSEPFKSVLFWFSLSLFLGPFAPLSLTGGDIRVGLGEIVNFPDHETDAADEKRSQPRRSKPRRSEEVSTVVAPVPSLANGKSSEKRKGSGNGAVPVVEEEKEWNEDDVEILKKQMVKHPVGKPGRWEAIASAFGGRHRTESVIKKAKELGEKKVGDSDSYSEFLKKRKPLDKRVVDEINGEEEEEGEKVESSWSNGEDIALLNALKAFPKDVAMRWEKVAAAVPGKSKAACMKRVAELKKGFRSAKATAQD